MVEGGNVRLEPMTEQGFASFREHYVEHNARNYTNAWRSETVAEKLAHAEHDAVYGAGLLGSGCQFFSLVDASSDEALGELVVRAVEERGEQVLLVEWLWMNPAHRGRGVACAALRELERAPLQPHCNFLIASCGGRELAAARTFAKAGFQETGVMMRLPLPFGARSPKPSVELVPLTEPQWAEISKEVHETYVQDLCSPSFPITVSRETADNLARRDHEGLCPQGLQTPGHTMAFIRDAISGRDVGIIWYGEREGNLKSGFIYEILVWEEFRNQGYGEAAMALAGSLLAAKGCLYMDFHVFAHNEKALRFYERLGAKRNVVLLQKRRTRA